MSKRLFHNNLNKIKERVLIIFQKYLFKNLFFNLSYFIVNKIINNKLAYENLIHQRILVYKSETLEVQY